MEKILVVEDDKNIAQLEIDYLNSSGYEQAGSVTEQKSSGN